MDFDLIEHPGIVAEIRNDVVVVKVLQVSACAGCHAKGACSMADMEEKEIEVEHYTGPPLRTGQQVTLQMKHSSGKRAILMGYLVPFFLLMTVLISGSFFIREEGLLALVSIGALVPYYALLYHFRDRLKKGFEIQIAAN